MCLGAVVVAEPPPLSPELRPFAAVGAALAEQMRLGEQGWTDAQVESFLNGMRTAVAGRPVEMDHAAHQLLGSMRRNIDQRGGAAGGSATRRDGVGRSGDTGNEVPAAYASFGADESEGLVVRVIERGAGPRPRPEDTVVISLAAKVAADGRDLPRVALDHARVRVTDLLPGLAQGVQMMALGGSAMLVVPPPLSFGDDDRKWPTGVAPGSVLVFKLELHDIEPAVAGPMAGSDH